MAEQETPQNQHQHTTQNPAAEGSTHTTQGRPEGSASTTVATDEPLAPHDFLVPADTDELIGAEHRDEDFDTLTDCDDDGLPDLSFRMDMDQLMGWEHPLPTGRYADREISWMAFNQRVLEQSEDPHLPLLERAWFSAIFTSNLDEFYMVRIAGLKRRIAAGIAKKSASGLEPTQVLEALRLRSRELVERQVEGFHTAILPALADHGIHLRHWNELNENQHERLSSHFRHQLFPVLTPLAVDPSHPFPYISGLSLTLAVLVRNPVSDKRHVALVKVPESFPRLVCVDSLGTTHPPQFYIGRNGGASFVTIEDIILAHLEHLFPGMEILEAFPFRLTRDEDLEVEEDEAEDLVTALETELAKRRFGAVVRMEIDQQMSAEVRDFLAEKLEVAAADLVALPTPLDMRLGNALHELAIPELCYPTYTPTTPSALQGNDPTISSDIFSVMRSQDILLHHPYDSFATTVQAFITQAARDPHVLAMKQTLYRTSGDSPIVSALIEAARAGKQVVAIVEIKARFDEEANIEWARKMERAGVHVVYGMVGLKTHCKLSLVVRQEGDVLRRYCHIGTGNYHPKTARGYEDFGLLTCNTDVAQDLTRLFNQLSGFAPRSTFHRLLVAPLSIRDGLIARIEEQTLRHLRGEEAWIGIKVNAVVDEKVIDALYRASQAGVRVDVLVRGICAIRAGIPGLSDNIRVRSILGRYLEHSRIYAFGPPGEEEVWIGSADLMHRNLDRRVEVLVRIEGDDHRRHLAQIIRQGTSAKVSSWRLRKGGTWKRKTHTKDAEPLRDLQHELMEETARNNRKIAELGAQVASLTLSTSGTESP